MIKLDLSSAEMRAQPIEGFMGARGELVEYPALRPPANQTAEQRIEQRKADAEDLRKWRLSTSLDGAKAFRKKYEDAGVKIQIMKVDAIDQFTDDEIDYMFNLANDSGRIGDLLRDSVEPHRAAGEIRRAAQNDDRLSRPHRHHQPGSFRAAAKLIGHFVAGNNTSPIPFLTKYHDRVTHIHVKDRKLNNGPAVPLGQGDTPVAEILQLMQKDNWKFPGIIEFEDKAPEGSTQMAEIAKCVEFCRKALA